MEWKLGWRMEGSPNYIQNLCRMSWMSWRGDGRSYKRRSFAGHHLLDWKISFSKSIVFIHFLPETRVNIPLFSQYLLFLPYGPTNSHLWYLLSESIFQAFSSRHKTCFDLFVKLKTNYQDGRSVATYWICNE